jgi:hypothetical protein
MLTPLSVRSNPTSTTRGRAVDLPGSLQELKTDCREVGEQFLTFLKILDCAPANCLGPRLDSQRKCPVRAYLCGSDHYTVIVRLGDGGSGNHG